MLMKQMAVFLTFGQNKSASAETEPAGDEGREQMEHQDSFLPSATGPTIPPPAPRTGI